MSQFHYRKTFCLAALLALVVSTLLGCGGAGDADPFAEHRERFLLEGKPAGALGIAEAKERLGVEELDEVVLVGQVDLTDLDMLAADEAVFLLREVVDDPHHQGDPNHDANCPFCKRKAAQAPRAAVQFVNRQGDVLPVGAKKLFELQQDDHVVVRGRPEMNAELDLLTITASGLYVAR